MPEVFHETAVVIPAAGNSARMGSHKALLPYDGQQSFIRKIVSAYAEAGIQKVVVVVNRDNADGIKASLRGNDFGNVQLVMNGHPEWERFYSIKCGLAEVAAYEACFIHNCDNPMVGAAVIRKIQEGFLKGGVTVPEFHGRRGHPVLLSRNIIQAVLGHPENSCNFKSFLSAFPTKTISVDNNSILFNINTREDLQNSF